MYRRLNITLPDRIVSLADEFARRERYTRSGLIAAALEAYISGYVDDPEPLGRMPGGSATRDLPLVAEPAAVYAPQAVGLNPLVRGLVPHIIDACRRHGVTWAALVGSSTQPDPAVRPADIDLLVEFGSGWETRAADYLGLKDEVERVSGLPVDLIEYRALVNAVLAEEFERTKVVLYEAP